MYKILTKLHKCNAYWKFTATRGINHGIKYCVQTAPGGFLHLGNHQRNCADSTKAGIMAVCTLDTEYTDLWSSKATVSCHKTGSRPEAVAAV